ncbi:putative inorganic phosphate cotransporter [Frankliniella occidentalis]|uniref:Inorganic phosphate cotransporter n=1 Tax=Frankliniella occidentalis TaxID=133901 RepID=A0A6J1SJX6_FRAOC|nr:putative inorganic phosphate cotransporter [Frankliniella occidentalis]
MFKIAVDWRKVYQGCIPQRYVLAIMGFLCLVNMFTIRVSLNVAITEMVLEGNASAHGGTEFVDPDACAEPEAANASVRHVTTVPEDDRFEWDEVMQGVLLSSFYWGYTLTQIPGGLLADRFGGKHTLTAGMVISILSTAAAPLAVRLGGWGGMLASRVVCGLGQGVMFPAINVLLAAWVPAEERGKLGALVLSGTNLGTVAGTAVSGTLIHFLASWDAVFYAFAAVASVWTACWCVLCYDSPAAHPYISSSESKYLQDKLSHKHAKGGGPIPWKAILTSLPLWGLVAKTVGHDWGLFTMIADLPKYMKSVMKFRIHENGFLSALPYLAMWLCSLMFGCLADWLIKTDRMSITNTRKLLTTISSLGPAAGIIGASYAGCDRYLVVSLFTLGMASMGAYYSGTRINALDLSPNYAGTIMALVNAIGALSGIVTPYIVGLLIPNSSMQEWRLVFWITVVVLIATNMVFVALGSGEVQHWNEPARQPRQRSPSQQITPHEEEEAPTRLESFRYIPEQ